MAKTVNVLMYFLLAAYLLLNPIIPAGSKISIIPDIILGLTIIICLIYSIKNRVTFLKNAKDFIKDYFGISMIALLAIMFISISYATDKTIALKESFRFLSFVMLYFIIKYNTTKDQIKGLVDCYLFTFIIINIAGIFQKVSGYGLPHLYFTPNTNIERIQLTFGNPNTFAAFLVLGIFPIVMMMVNCKKIYQKVFYGIIVLLALSNIYFTGSRNSFVAIAIGGIAISVFYNWRFIVGLIGVGIIAIIFKGSRNRIIDIGNMSLDESRIKLWKLALKMIKDHPIRGVGNGNYSALYGTYVKKYNELMFINVPHYPSHNSYLKVEAELGIVGGLSLLGIIINAIIKVKKVTTELDDKFFKLFFIGFLASMIGFLVMNISDNFLFALPKVEVYFWFFIAAADSLLYKEKFE